MSAKIDPTVLQALLKNKDGLRAYIEKGWAIELERGASPEEVQRLYKHDPLGFVMQEWPWGKPGGPLEFSKGPDKLQRQFLIDLGAHVKRNNFDGHTSVPAVKMAISSSHSTGKTTLGAFIAWWIMRTRPMSVGTVTAGTFQQLEERTWADIMYWGGLARGAKYFDIQKSGIAHKDPLLREKWKCNPKTAAQGKSQSFAGQHAQTSTSWFLVDEASEVYDDHWPPMYGGMMDGEPMMFAWGQMLSSTGEFYKVCFGDASNRWDTRIWDGRDSGFTNKETIKEWIEEYGEESDFVRVRILGLPPQASALQFIQQKDVTEARKREHKVLEDEPLIVGFDAANGGLARFVIAFRRGLDAKSIPPIILPGDTHRDVVVGKLCEIMSDRRPGMRVAALFGDQAFGSVILQRVKDSGYTNCFEVNFGEQAMDSKKYFNARAQIWDRMKEWLYLGSIPDNEKMAQSFLSPGFSHRNGRLLLESKESMAHRRIKSPDYPDALACTFFRKVAAPAKPQVRKPDAWTRGGNPSQGWMG